MTNLGPIVEINLTDPSEHSVRCWVHRDPLLGTILNSDEDLDTVTLSTPNAEVAYLVIQSVSFGWEGHGPDSQTIQEIQDRMECLDHFNMDTEHEIWQLARLLFPTN